MFARAMDHGKIKRLQMRDPPRDHPFWLPEVTQPHQASVVSHHGKMLSSNVLWEQLNRHHNCQQFVTGAVAMLRVAKSLGSIRNYFLSSMPSIFPLLPQHSSYPDIAGIGAENEVSLSGGTGHGCRHQSCLESPKGFLACIVPYQVHSLSCQVGHRGCHGREAGM